MAAPRTRQREVEFRLEGQYSQKTLLNVFSRIKGLSGLSPPQLARLAKSPVRLWGPDEYLIREGRDDIDRMAIILAGSVFIRKRVARNGVEHYEQIARITGPAIVGENSFFTGLERSAGVYARDKAPGIPVDKGDFMRLVSLDKKSIMSFLSHIAEDNLRRAERTAVLYMNTLQLALNQASISQLGYHRAITALRERLENGVEDTDQMQELVREILMLIRDLNSLLENLYGFANLPDIKALSIDLGAFATPKTHPLHPAMKALAGELHHMQSLAPLETVNFKEALLHSVMAGSEKGGSNIDFSAIVREAKDIYRRVIASPFEMGLAIKIIKDSNFSVSKTATPKNDLLWD